MIKLYGIALSNNVNKVRYCLDYLKLAYEIVPINPLQGSNQTPEYQAITPTQKIPSLDDNGFKIFESNAIIRYLAEKQKSPIYPQDLQKRTTVNAWMDFSSIHIGTSLGRVMFNRVVAPMLNKEVDQNSLNFGLEMLSKYLPIADKQLGANTYIAGSEFSIADFDLLAVLDPCEMCQVDLTSYKNLTRWRDDLKKRDFYQNAAKDQQAFMQSMMAKK